MHWDISMVCLTKAGSESAGGKRVFPVLRTAYCQSTFIPVRDGDYVYGARICSA